MLHSIESKIQIVVLLAKFESPIMVNCELQRQGAIDIPVRQTITSIYQKFLETGSVQNLSRAGRPSIITKDKIQEVEEILKIEPPNSIGNIAR